MSQQNFSGLLQRAQALSQFESDLFKSAWWSGYIRGLRRAHHGENFGTDDEHVLWSEAAESTDRVQAARGQGYKAGLTLEPCDPS